MKMSYTGGKTVLNWGITVHKVMAMSYTGCSRTKHKVMVSCTLKQNSWIMVFEQYIE